MNRTAGNLVSVRRALPEDAGSVSELAGQLGYTVAADLVSGTMNEAIADSRQAVFVADMDELAVVGWIHVYVRPTLLAEPSAEIGALVLEETLRHRGIGRSLIKEGERWAASKGCRSIRVRVNTARKEADRFYHDLGYGIVKTQSVFTKRLAMANSSR